LSNIEFGGCYKAGIKQSLMKEESANNISSDAVIV
jgi:hypothetical protein